MAANNSAPEAGNRVKTAGQLQDGGLIAFLENLGPLAEEIEQDARMFREFARQAQEVQPAPPTVADGLHLIDSILAPSVAEAQGAWASAKGYHEKDFERAKKPVRNGQRGDVRWTMRDGEEF